MRTRTSVQSQQSRRFIAPVYMNTNAQEAANDAARHYKDPPIDATCQFSFPDGPSTASDAVLGSSESRGSRGVCGRTRAISAHNHVGRRLAVGRGTNTPLEVGSRWYELGGGYGMVLLVFAPRHPRGKGEGEGDFPREPSPPPKGKKAKRQKVKSCNSVRHSGLGRRGTFFWSIGKRKKDR